MNQTSRFLEPLFNWLFPNADLDFKRFVLTGVRKLAHPVEYGIFAALMFRALWLALQRGRRIAALGALGFAALLSVADEARQWTSELRTGSVYDVGLDLTGALIALVLLFIVQRFWTRARSNAPATAELQ